MDRSLPTLGRILESGNHSPDVQSADGNLLPRRQDLQVRIESFFSSSDLDNPLISRLRCDIDGALDDLYAGKPVPSDGLAPLAIVIADGSRPVFFMKDDDLEAKGQIDGPFVDVAKEFADKLVEAAHSVGRVETDEKLPPLGVDKWYEGTAFLVGGDIAMTNRHVVERMVNEPESSDGPFSLKATYWLNFGAQSQKNRLRIEEVVYAGPDVIGRGGDIAKLDLALLRVGPAEEASMVAPPPIRLSTAPLMAGQKIAVIGFPAAPRPFTGGGIPPPEYEIEDIWRRLFDSRFGLKRCASGQIEAAAGFPEDTKRWTIKHDASTLSGNSGSPIFLLADGQFAASALHFSGTPRVANLAHVFDRIATDLRAHGVEVNG